MTTPRPHLSHPKYRPDIDGLRAIAVLSVVAFHAFPNGMKGGFIGVDVFFVISGFLISTIIFENLDNRTFGFAEFYARRIRRIFPALALVLVASYSFGWYALIANEYKQLGKHIAAGAGFVSNFVLWSESGYFDNSAETKPLLHLWSLGIEEQFYIVWPLMLWFAWRLKFNLLVLTVLAALGSFALNVTGVKHDPVATFYAPQTRFWELLCGSILAWFALYKASACSSIKLRVAGWFAKATYRKEVEPDGRTLSSVLSFLGCLLLAYGFWRINKTVKFPGMWAVVPVLGAVLVILAGPQAWINRQILSNRIVVWVGLISFPLYLWHWPLLSFARIVESEQPSRGIRLAAVVLSVALAWLTSEFVERPIRSGGRSKVKVAILVFLMAVIGCVGYATYKGDGFGFRFPKMVQELTEYKYDYQSGYREGTCFLRPEQGFKEFHDCQLRNPQKPKTILLWGDSYAAHLYPGLKNRYEANFNIAQFTASSCPPILTLEVKGREHCRRINDFVFDKIRAEPADIVVLSAIWINYDLSKLVETLAMLKKAGVQDIYVVGPVPQWNDGLPKQLVTHFDKYVPHVIPERMTTGLNPSFFETDDLLRERIKTSGAKYISPRRIFCDANGCITKLGRAIDSITAWDSGHLTGAGSEFLVSGFPGF